MASACVDWHRVCCLSVLLIRYCHRGCLPAGVAAVLEWERGQQATILCALARLYARVGAPEDFAVLTSCGGSPLHFVPLCALGIEALAPPRAVWDAMAKRGLAHLAKPAVADKRMAVLRNIQAAQ